jgi:methylmalonyl-CoA mutase cobalamin-binding domain/chain
VPEILKQLADRDATDIPVFVGGIIPKADAEALKARGILEVFTPGAPLDTICDVVNKAVQLIQSLGGQVATVDEARQILGLTSDN